MIVYWCELDIVQNIGLNTETMTKTDFVDHEGNIEGGTN